MCSWLSCRTVRLRSDFNLAASFQTLDTFADGFLSLMSTDIGYELDGTVMMSDTMRDFVAAKVCMLCVFV